MIRRHVRQVRALGAIGLVVALGLGLTPSVASASPAGPADQFGTAPTIPRSGGSFETSNVGATKQIGEPNHAGNRGGRSIWIRFRPDRSGIVKITTANSDFDTLLAVYTGNQVSALTLVRQDDDSGPGVTSRLQFPATAGVVYRIAIDGYRYPTGPAASGYVHFAVLYV